MDSSLKEYLAEKFIADFREDRLENKKTEELLETIRSSPEIVDCMRSMILFDNEYKKKHIPPTDRERIIAFFRSRNDIKIHIAHAFARKLLKEEGVKEALIDAHNYIKSCNNTDVIITQLYLMHDLLEYPDWRENQNNIQMVVDFFEQKCSSKLIFDEFKSEENLFLFCISRLKDVFGLNETFNSQEKAFIYLLYLGKLKDKTLRNKAYNELEYYKNIGNTIFKELFDKIQPSLKS